MTRLRYRLLLFFAGFLALSGICLCARAYVYLKVVSNYGGAFLTGILAVLGGVGLLVILLDWSERNAVDKMATLEDEKVAFEDMEERFMNEQDEPVAAVHDDSYLRGFADAADFFLKNYLVSENTGPSEKQFWDLVFKMHEEEARKSKTIKAKTLSEFDSEQDAYRFYMVSALMVENGISSGEYNAIAQACRTDEVRQLLGRILYHENLVIMEQDDLVSLMSKFKEEYKNEEEE